jgi:hypothetical protein
MILKSETLLDKAFGAWQRPYFLLHVSPGIVPAGAGARYQNECYRVMSLNRDGTRHSTAYKTLDEARSVFESVTTPICAIEA